MKPYPKTAQRIVTVTIEDDGRMTYLATDAADIFLECGETITRRASHVEPATFWARQAFHILRRFVTDKSGIASWTRTWACGWRVNTSPVGGGILTWGDVLPEVPLCMAGDTYVEYDRQRAIDSEIKFLNVWFAERG
jgi:hypothetical protein